MYFRISEVRKVAPIAFGQDNIVLIAKPIGEGSPFLN